MIGAVAAVASGQDIIGIVIGTLAGVAGGILTASGAGVFLQAVGSAAISMLSNAAQQIHQINDSNGQVSFDWVDMVADGAVSFICGVWGGSGASYGNSSEITAAGKQLFHEGIFSSQSWSNYYTAACRINGEFVLKPLAESLEKAYYGNAAITIKNLLKDILYGGE